MKLISKDYDKATGITDEYWHDEAAGTITIRRLQDIEPHLKHNVRQFNEHDGVNYRDSKGLHKIASIPFITLERWKREYGFDWFKSTDKERRAMLMKHPKLLVRPGKL